MFKKTPDLNAESYPSLKVALCQVRTAPWMVEENTDRTIEALRHAAAQGAELAVTPECVLHGYADRTGDDFAQRLREVAEPLDGPGVARFRDLARELALDIVIGLAERGEGDRVHNTALTISRGGEIVDVYRKVHCRHFESIEHEGLFTPGDCFNVHTLRYDQRAFNVGTMICFDREVPETVRCLRGLGAALIVCPLACDTHDMREPLPFADNEMITRVRATENEVFIVVVNHAGRFNGGSFAVGPGGEALLQLGTEPEVAVIDLPVGVVPARMHNDPLGWMGWGYRRPEVYRGYLEM